MAASNTVAKLATGPKDCQGTQGPVDVRDGVDGSFAHALPTCLSERRLVRLARVRLVRPPQVQEALAGSQAPSLHRHREGCPSPRDRGGYAVGRDEWDFAIAVHDILQTFVVRVLVHC